VLDGWDKLFLKCVNLLVCAKYWLVVFQACHTLSLCWILTCCFLGVSYFEFVLNPDLLFLRHVILWVCAEYWPVVFYVCHTLSLCWILTCCFLGVSYFEFVLNPDLLFSRCVILRVCAESWPVVFQVCHTSSLCWILTRSDTLWRTSSMSHFLWRWAMARVYSNALSLIDTVLHWHS